MKTGKTNVLFIVTDDQRYDTIAALGNRDIKTPAMNELVENGVSFTNAYIPCGLIGAVCMPSRAMINTGRGLFDIEKNGENIPRDHKLIGELLKENNFHCFGTGKWHNGPESFTRNFTTGSHAFFSGMWDHWNVPTCDYDVTGEYDNVVNFVVDFWKSNQITKINCDRFNPGVHSSTLLADSTIDFINDHDCGSPFYVYTAFLAPHDPRTMPEEYLDYYDEEKLTLTPNITGRHPFNYGVENIRDELLAGYPRDEKLVRKELKEYYAMITHLDFEVGRIIQALKDKGLYENTLIILCGDNGLSVGQHGLMGKQNNYEHSLKIPLIFSGALIPHNKRVDSFVFLHDIFPTLCELLKIEIPESVTGLSFYKMFEDGDYFSREGMYYAYENLLRSCRVGDYKIIEYRNYIDETQLFNIAEDPYETKDLSKDERCRNILQEMKKHFERFSVSSGDRDDARSQKYWKSF